MKPTAKILALPSRLECSECGTSMSAACDCRAPYVPAGERAAKALAKNPAKSDRAIAAELGVGAETVRRARQSTAPHEAVEARTGRDGRTRQMPKKSPPVVVGGEIMSQREAKRIARELAETKLLAMRDQINGFTRELSKFEDNFVPRLMAWHEANPEIEPDGQHVLVLFLTNFSIRFANIAQKIDGR